MRAVLDVDSYLKRIGYAGSRSATLETLRALQVLHPLAIPFENLDTLSGRPVSLDLPSLERKLVHGRRGGYCFEQNLLFNHVLRALGFDAAALAARVVWERPADEVRARTSPAGRSQTTRAASAAASYPSARSTWLKRRFCSKQ